MLRSFSPADGKRGGGAGRRRAVNAGQPPSKPAFSAPSLAVDEISDCF